MRIEDHTYAVGGGGGLGLGLGEERRGRREERGEITADYQELSYSLRA